MFPGVKKTIVSLNKCSDFLEIKLPKEKYHSSKNDCFAVAKIISKLYDIIQISKEKQNQENKDNVNNNESYKISENGQNKSISGQKSEKSNKNSEFDFDYSESIIDLIEEENRNDENRSENIVINNEKNKNEKSVSNKSDYNYEFSEKKEKNKSKLLNNKRKVGEFDDLLKNLKYKVGQTKDDELKEIKNIEINLDENEFKQIEKELGKKKEK